MAYTIILLGLPHTCGILQFAESKVSSLLKTRTFARTWGSLTFAMVCERLTTATEQAGCPHSPRPGLGLGALVGEGNLDSLPTLSCSSGIFSQTLGSNPNSVKLIFSSPDGRLFLKEKRAIGVWHFVILSLVLCTAG